MHLCGLQACLSSKRRPWWAAGNPQEEEMIKLTANDLVRKSSRELTALFNQVTRQRTCSPRLSADFAAAGAALRLIRYELARRGLRPG